LPNAAGPASYGMTDTLGRMLSDVSSYCTVPFLSLSINISVVDDVGIADTTF